MAMASFSPQSLLWKMALLSTLLVSLMGLSFLALKSPFHPQDLLPLLPRQVSWPILNSLHSAVDILPVFVGAAFASSMDDTLEWKGACLYKNKAWMVFHNKSQSEFGGGTLYIKVSNAHSWTCIDLYIFATPYRVTWDHYFLAGEHTLEFKEWEGRAEYEYVKNHGVSIFLIKAWMLGTLQALWEVFPLFTNDSKKVQKWRSWHFQNDRYLSEYELVQKISYSVIQSLFGYDVFLSFGEDTRNSFTGFLYNALRQEGFKTFFMHDEEAFEGGNQISQFHIQAIEESKFSIIVFSKIYAYCSWCLDVLVKILECKKLKKQRVFPIFYKVEPSDVRYQTSHYSKAMAAHEITFGKDSEKVQKWRSALYEVANLKGWHFETGYEYKTIRRIVELVSKSLSRYDVFLSFSGQDTRQNFTGYLYNALCKKGLKTFMDDEALEGGDQISQSLINAIEESRLSIIVFSENYANSSWCLDELVKILECKKMKYHLVWPIFYKVEPLDVMHQMNSYGEAMAAHENRYRDDPEKVQKWRSALYEVANLEGWHFQTGYEYEFIERIVEMATNICSGVN